jgi:hypothetical protein
MHAVMKDGLVRHVDVSLRLFRFESCAVVK